MNYLQLDVQIEVAECARAVRENVKALNASKDDVVEAIGKCKESIKKRLEDEAVSLSKVAVVGVSGETPGQKIGVYKFVLWSNGPESFVSMFIREVETFLDVLFPSEPRRWSRHDVEMAYASSVSLCCICDSMIDPMVGIREDLMRLHGALRAIKRKMDSIDYDSESQQVQLQMAEMQLELARNQDAIAKRSEKMNLCMIAMTVVVTIATVVTLVLSWLSYSASLENPNTEAIETISEEVADLNELVGAMGQA